MTRTYRIVAVTLGLMGAGIICGAVAGAVAITVVLTIMGDWLPFEGATGGAVVGGILGAIAAPSLSWLLLRRVPLGRMFWVCTLGTIVGGVVGGILGAFLGCLGAAAILHGMSDGSARLAR